MADTENKLTGVDTSLYPKFGPLPGQGQQPVNMLTGLSQTLGVAGQAQGLQQQQLETGIKQNQYLHDQLGALVAKVGPDGKPNATFADVANTAANLVRIGLPTDMVTAALTSAPRDSAGIQAWASQHQQAVANHNQRWGAAYGVPSTVNVGDEIRAGTVNQRTGAFSQAGAPQRLGMSPEAAAAPRSFTTDTGQTGTAPASAFVDRTGYGRPSPVSSPTNSASGAGPVDAMRPAGMQGGAVPQVGGGAIPGALPTGLPTGQTRMMDASADRLTADLDSARNLHSDLVPIQNARAAITALGPGGIGPGTADRQKVASALQSAGLGWLPGVDSDRIENMDEAGKYLVQAQQTRAAAIRAGTDQQQNTAAAGSPNLKMSSTAALNVLNAMEGMRRMQQAQTFENAHDSQGYVVNSAKWASSQDPRAYYFDRMSADQKSKVISSLGSKDSAAYKRFMGSLRSAHSTGLMDGGAPQ